MLEHDDYYYLYITYKKALRLVIIDRIKEANHLTDEIISEDVIRDYMNDYILKTRDV